MCRRWKSKVGYIVILGERRCVRLPIGDRYTALVSGPVSML